jgi:HSP20 family protein
MSLIPWRGDWPSLSSLQREINRVFEGFFDDDMGLTRPSGFAPAIDVAETPETVVVKAEVPGLDPKDVEISVTGDTLTIRGEKREEKEEKGKTWHRVERRYGAFARSVTLPAPIDPNHVEAVSSHGLLTITIGKSKEAKPKKIEVKVR